MATFAQTIETGAMVVRVSDGIAPLSGAAIQVRSPALPGVRSGTADSTGWTVFALLPPGTYEVTVSRAGFATKLHKDVAVGLAKTTAVDVALQRGIAEEVTIHATAPVVDVRSTISGVEITSEALGALPLQRRYTAAAIVAPGTQSDFLGPAIYGSTSPENQYIIDGLNVTDVIAGHDTKNVSVDFVDHVQVMTAGLPAEYGRVTGGIVNAATKTGSNELRGTAFGYRAVGKMIAQPKYLDDYRALGATQWGRTDENADYGLAVGGALLRDRVWGFGAYDRVIRRGGQVRLSNLNVPGFSLPAGGKVGFLETSDLQSFKLTVAIRSSHSATVSVFGDPWTRSGALAPIQGPPSTWEGTSARGGMNWVGRYSGTVAPRWAFNASVGQHGAIVNFRGPGTSTPVLVDRSVAPPTRTGGFGQYSDNRNQRFTIKGDVAALLFRRHTLKFGVDVERQRNNIVTYFSGGDRIIKMCSVALVSGSCPPNGIIYYEHSGWVNDLSTTFDRTNPDTYSRNIVNPMVARFTGTNQAAFFQDSWTAGPITMNAGLRWERQVLNERTGKSHLTVNNFAPRLGLAWDPENRGRSKLYGHYGRYFESIPMYMDVYFGTAAFLRVNNLSPVPGNFTPDPAAPGFGASGRRYLLSGGAAPTPIERRIKGQYLDEYVLGYERAFGNAVTVGAKALHRNMPRIIEDVALDLRAGKWLIGNPGEGEARSISMISGEIVSTPRPTRRYNAVELSAARRFTGTTQLHVSYVWSRLYGNYEGLFQSSIGQLSPNVNAAFDYGDYLINAYGLLPNDRTHQLKLYGTYTVTHRVARGASIALGTYWYSGAPLSAMSSGQFLAPRGSLGRGPSTYEADIHLGFPVEMRRARVELLVDVFNVLNRQSATELDQAYRTFVDGPCGGIPQDLCNRFGGLKNKPGTTQPLGKITDPRATAPNPNFLKGGLFFTPPRQIRAGARVRF